MHRDTAVADLQRENFDQLIAGDVLRGLLQREERALAVDREEPVELLTAVARDGVLAVPPRDAAARLLAANVGSP